jgi:urease accessory protein
MIAEKVGADLSVMERDSLKMRDSGPFIFTQVKFNKGVDEIVEKILDAKKRVVCSLSFIQLGFQD